MDFYFLAASTIRLKHRAPVIYLTILDASNRPIDVDSSTSTVGHKLVICSEEQLKVIIIVKKN